MLVVVEPIALCILLFEKNPFCCCFVAYSVVASVFAYFNKSNFSNVTFYLWRIIFSSLLLFNF